MFIVTNIFYQHEFVNFFIKVLIEVEKQIWRTVGKLTGSPPFLCEPIRKIQNISTQSGKLSIVGRILFALFLNTKFIKTSRNFGT